MAKTHRAQIRKSAGLTQMKLAKLTDISQARISAWEAEDVELNPKDVAKIASTIQRHLDRAPQFQTANDLLQALTPNLHSVGSGSAPHGGLLPERRDSDGFPDKAGRKD